MPRRLALLVGINDYGDDSGLSALNFAEADVDLLSTVLIEKGGFDTTVLKGRDATHDGIVRALREFYRQSDLGLFLFYFAGHGEMLSEIGRFSLHCFGSEAQDTIGTLTLSEVAQRVRDKIPAPSAVLLIDACRNKMYRGAQSRGLRDGLSASAVADLRLIGQQEVPRFWEPESVNQAQEQFLVTFMACGVGQYSYEDSVLGHGVFTYGLVQELRGCRGAVPLSELRKRVGDFTRAHCRTRKLVPVQIPEWIEPSISAEVYLGEEPSQKKKEPSPSSTKERRDVRRFRMSLPVKLKLTHSPKNFFPVRLQDISYRGAFIESDYPISEGQEVWIELVIPKPLSKTKDVVIHLLATAIRVERSMLKWKVAVSIQKYEFAKPESGEGVGKASTKVLHETLTQDELASIRRKISIDRIHGLHPRLTVWISNRSDFNVSIRSVSLWHGQKRLSMAVPSERREWVEVGSKTENAGNGFVTDEDSMLKLQNMGIVDRHLPQYSFLTESVDIEVRSEYMVRGLEDEHRETLGVKIYGNGQFESQ